MVTRADGRPRSGGPRQQLLVAGPQGLTDVELLGIVLDAGRAGSSARARAERILAEVGGLERLERAGHDAWRSLGAHWTRGEAAIRAALELGRRAVASACPLGVAIRGAAQGWEHFRGRLPQLEREGFWVLLLDGRNRVQGEVQVSEGTLTAALVHPREVFSPALAARAAALVLVHNHPSGDPTPSSEDETLTERLRQVGDLLGIRVLDHVVIAKAGWVSMAEAGRW